jgi:hypothetical protein
MLKRGKRFDCAEALTNRVHAVHLHAISCRYLGIRYKASEKQVMHDVIFNEERD